MALAVTFPTQLLVGDRLIVSGTGATASGSIKVDVSEEDQSSLSVIGHVTASGGAFTTDGAFDVIANRDGFLNVTVTDITAVVSKTARIEVFQEG